MPLIKAGLPCESCGSSDALALYSDGTYCFSCKKHTHKLVFAPNIPTITFHSPKNLDRCNFGSLPKEAIKWLKKYGLTDEEISENKFSWDGTSNRLVYPIKNTNSVTGYEKREITGGTPKTICQGRKVDSFHIIQPNKEEFKGVVAVEDIISAIKVGRVAKALCLFGSQVSLSQYNEISRITNLFILWLDLDKFNQAVKIAQKAKSFGIETKIIKTDLDPKMYSTEEIRRTINEI